MTKKQQDSEPVEPTEAPTVVVHDYDPVRPKAKKTKTDEDSE